MNVIQSLKSHLLNLPGWRTKRKIVVFESDDWGQVRMPGPKAFQALLSKGIRVDKSKYDSLDCLEKKEDIENLVEVLLNYKDANGNPPIFTTNMVMGNPDFEAIRKNGYCDFVHEHFFTSYDHYYGQKLESLWKNSIESKALFPQFHAREHLNTQLWMRDLQTGLRDTRIAFDHNFYGVKTQTSSPHQKNYLAAYHTDSMEELRQTEKIITDGLHMFQDTFGLSSKTFTPCNYIWPKELEPYLSEKGIQNYQVQSGNTQPDPSKGGKHSTRRLFTGRRNRFNQTYSVRNVHFEPYIDADTAVEKAIAGIARSFFWNKPAIICTHRINYVSGMSLKHRDENISRLKQLLEKIVNAFPDVEFHDSGSLATKMQKQ